MNNSKFQFFVILAWSKQKLIYISLIPFKTNSKQIFQACRYITFYVTFTNLNFVLLICYVATFDVYFLGYQLYTELVCVML